MLADPRRCQVLLVTAPEETPVNEAVETAYRLEDEVGMSLGPIVVNGCYPVLADLDADPAEAARCAGIAPPSAADLQRLAAAASFRAGRQELQRHQIERLDEELPLPRIVLPYLFTAGIGASEVDELAAAMTESIVKLP